jgi:selenocysteine-specific elongation factor
VQVHGSAADSAVAGQRTALNLAGISTEDLARGMTLATADTFRSTSRVDALALSSSLGKAAQGRRACALSRLHDGNDCRGSVVWSQTAQSLATSNLRNFACRNPLLLPGDRFIVRQFSPVVTIGGGVVLDAFARSRKQRAEDAAVSQVMRDGSPEQILAARVGRGSHWTAFDTFPAK